MYVEIIEIADGKVLVRRGRSYWWLIPGDVIAVDTEMSAYSRDKAARLRRKKPDKEDPEGC